MDLSTFFFNFAQVISLDRHIEILLLSNDCVIVPDFGGFMAHHIDARKDDSDGSFLPPIRSIGFNPRLTINDSLLAQSYVEAYDISYPDAIMRIEDEVRELKQHLEVEGEYVFDDIGTVKLNSDGNYEFTPCEAGIVSPELYGLGSFRMSTTAELRKAAQQDAARVNEDGNKAVTITSTAGEENEERHRYIRTIALWRNIAVACIAFIIFMLIPTPLVNNTQIAGNHINTALLDRVMPKDITTGQERVSQAVRNNKEKVTETKAAKDDKAESETGSIGKNKDTKDGFSIVLASHVTLKNADAYAKDLQRRGYENVYVYRRNHVKVLMGNFQNQAEAAKVLRQMHSKPEFEGAWIDYIKH